MTLSSPHALLPMACVDIPALPLQQVLQKHPQWKSDPLVIVAEDKPTAPVLWANQAAQRQRIVRGLPFTQAKSLSVTLRAQVVPQSEIDSAVDAIFDLLVQYSPYVEPVLGLPGLFFLDPTGLGSLFGSHDIWARQVQKSLRSAHYQARVAVGFSRPLLYALCQAHHQRCPYISSNPMQENAHAANVPLRSLRLSSKAIDDMALLGVQTVGDFLALPVSQLRLRYGDDLAFLHEFLSGQRWTPLQPRSPLAPLEAHLEVDPPDAEISRLLFGIKNLLHEILRRAESRCEAITALGVHFSFEYKDLSTPEASNSTNPVCIEAAAPTLDPVQLIDLLRLRFSTISLPAPVREMTLCAESMRVHPKQLHLRHAQHRRDLAAANRALARLKAQFGKNAVNRAQLRSAHLPEARFIYEPCPDVLLPRPGFLSHRMPLVRRLHRPPTFLPSMGTHRPEAWFTAEGSVHHMLGPYRIAGGWWAKPRERDYYFVETKFGDILWVFYDRPRRRWLLHGVVS